MLLNEEAKVSFTHCCTLMPAQYRVETEKSLLAPIENVDGTLAENA